MARDPVEQAMRNQLAREMRTMRSGSFNLSQGIGMDPKNPSRLEPTTRKFHEPGKLGMSAEGVRKLKFQRTRAATAILVQARITRKAQIEHIATSLSRTGKMRMPGLAGLAAGSIGDIADIRQKKGYAKTPEAQGRMPGVGTGGRAKGRKA